MNSVLKMPIIKMIASYVPNPRDMSAYKETLPI